MLFLCPLIEQTLANEGGELAELVIGEADRRLQQRIDPGQDRLDRAQPMDQVRVETRSFSIVRTSRFEHIEMVPDGIVQSRKRAVMEKRRLQRHVTQW
jgi:hypothetical protein